MKFPVSDRLAALSPSETLAMSQKSNELKAQGIDVINLSVGEPDFFTPDHIKEAAKQAVDNNFSFYSPVPGYPALRNAICAKQKMNVMMAAERHNPSHALACLAAYALGFFVLKRDVVFRRSFGITKIIMALNLLGIDEHEVSQTVTELEFKGCVERLRYFDRLKSRLGLM